MSEDTLRVMCPNLACRKILAVPSSARGKTVRCRGCSTSIRIPNSKVPETPAKPAEGVAPAQAPAAKPAA